MSAKIEILENISSQKLGNKKVEKIAKEAYRNFKITSHKSLEKASDLAFWLYIYDQKDLSLSVCELITSIEFSNNYNIWTWVETALALQSRLLKEKNQIDFSQQSINRIRQPLNEGDETLKSIKAKTMIRRLDGELLKSNKILESENDEDSESEIEYRLAHLKELIYISELGGSERLSVEKLELEIVENVNKLKV